MKEALAALPAGEPVYAVLDGARDRHVRQWAVHCGGAAWCLYRGELSPALQSAAPYLLRLTGTLFDEFFERAWGKSWGVLLTSTASSRDLRRHLRKFLIAQTEARERMLFRYYDPRVLRVYLPTCNGGELAEFFGPISAYLAEGEDASKWQVFKPPEAARSRPAFRSIPRPEPTW